MKPKVLRFKSMMWESIPLQASKQEKNTHQNSRFHRWYRRKGEKKFERKSFWKLTDQCNSTLCSRRKPTSIGHHNNLSSPGWESRAAHALCHCTEPKRNPKMDKSVHYHSLIHKSKELEIEHFLFAWIAQIWAHWLYAIALVAPEPHQ